MSLKGRNQFVVQVELETIGHSSKTWVATVIKQQTLLESFSY